MWRVLLALVLAGGCSFQGAGVDPSGDGDGDGDDAGPDAPPATPDVRFTTISSTINELRPGIYGFEITLTLRNELPNEISDLRVSLTLADQATERSNMFRWRDPDRRDGVMTSQPVAVPADDEVDVRFRVNALANAIGTEPILVNGAAAFVSQSAPLSATPSATPLSLPFAAANAPIVVNNATDENDGLAPTSFREALVLAQNTAGPDRIVFDSTVFPSGSKTPTLLDETLDELPTIDEDLVIDGSGAGFELAIDNTWEQSEGRYGLRINGGTVVISQINFRDMGFNYRDENIAMSGNCGDSDQQLEGGAIRVDNGTLILDDNELYDPAVNERNCYAASVRVHGGSGHRIVENRWTDQSMDAIYIDAATIEISNNTMDAGSDNNKVDECIYVDGQGDEDLWITGNLCIDQEFSAIVARGNANGSLYVVNNTFVRNQALSAVRREGDQRPVVLRNNLYINNIPAAIRTTNAGSDFDIAYEAYSGSAFCTPDCGNATIDNDSIGSDDPMVVNDSGTTVDDFAPQLGSPLIDSGEDWLDRNGRLPRRHNGDGADRGAIEL